MLKRSLLNCVPYVLKTCSRANAPCMLSCSRGSMPCMLIYSHGNVSCFLTCSCANVSSLLTCSCLNMPCVLIYSRVNVACELTGSRANMPWVPCLTRLVWTSDPLPTCLASSVSSFYATFFGFTAIVVETGHTVGKV